MDDTNKVIVTKRELSGLIKKYGLSKCFDPLKRLVRERGLVLNYVSNHDGRLVGDDFKSYVDSSGNLIHENIAPKRNYENK